MRKFLQLLAVLKLFPRSTSNDQYHLKSSNHPLAAYIERLKAGGASAS